MLKPCGHRLKVKAPAQDEVDEITRSAKASGLIIVNSNTARENLSVDKGTVVEIGPTCWHDHNSPPWCKVGDEIIFAKLAGKLCTDPDTQEDYFIINDEDVIAVIKES